MAAPPPPPPPPLPEFPEEIQVPPEIINPPPQRLALLDSIRQAGGIGRCNLKSVRERKLAEQPKRPPGGRGGPADLMGDLRANLQLRRGRGMAGLRGGLRPSGRGLRK